MGAARKFGPHPTAFSGIQVVALRCEVLERWIVAVLRQHALYVSSTWFQMPGLFDAGTLWRQVLVSLKPKPILQAYSRRVLHLPCVGDMKLLVTDPREVYSSLREATAQPL